jgi:signal transduction histidine kinase
VAEPDDLAADNDRSLPADVARFTHETANLLTAMLANVELLLRAGDLNEPARADAQTLLDSTRQVLTLVYELGAKAGGTRRPS